MSAFLLLAVFLAVAVPLGLALCSQPQRGRTGVGEAPDASREGGTPEPGIAKVVDALVAALRARGDAATAELVDRAFYGAATGGELVMGMRSVLGTIDRRKLQDDVSLLMRIERFLSEELPAVRQPGKVIRQVNFAYTLLEDDAASYIFELVIPSPEMAAVVYTKKIPASPMQKRLIQERPEAADEIADGLIRDEKARQREAWSEDN